MEIAIDIEVLKLNSAYERGGDARRLTYGVLGKTLSYLAVKVSFRVAREKYK